MLTCMLEVWIVRHPFWTHIKTSNPFNGKIRVLYPPSPEIWNFHRGVFVRAQVLIRGQFFYLNFLFWCYWIYHSSILLYDHRLLSAVLIIWAVIICSKVVLFLEILNFDHATFPCIMLIRWCNTTVGKPLNWKPPPKWNQKAAESYHYLNRSSKGSAASNLHSRWMII